MIGEMNRHFRVDAVAGAGGTGVVNRAFDTHWHCPVDLKMLRSDLTVGQ